MRALMAVVAGACVLMLVPAPAHGQGSGLRDPFDPLVSPETGEATATTAPTTTVEPVTTAEEPAETDGLPSTGADVTVWLVVAYLLGACGAAALVRGYSGAAPPPRRVRT